MQRYAGSLKARAAIGLLSGQQSDEAGGADAAEERGGCFAESGRGRASRARASSRGAARTALARLFCARAGPFLERIRPGLERDGFSYLLALRLIPVLPFWLLNLAPALVGMRLVPFALATLIGIIPGTLVFASIGAGAGQLLAAGSQPDWRIVFSPSVLLPFVGLALLSLAPVAWRHWKSARG